MTASAKTIELQGHRGARGVLPENTIPGFKNAIAAGSNCLELDIAMTRDGRIVITHDPVFNPDIVSKDGSWVTDPPPIKSLTYEEVKTYDVGTLRPRSEYARRFAKQQAIDDLPIPLLEDLFELPEVKNNPTLCHHSSHLRLYRFLDNGLQYAHQVNGLV